MGKKLKKTIALNGDLDLEEISFIARKLNYIQIEKWYFMSN